MHCINKDVDMLIIFKLHAEDKYAQSKVEYSKVN